MVSLPRTRAQEQLHSAASFPSDVMELGLSPPHCSSSPEDLYPAPGTPPGTPPPLDVPLSGEVKRSQPLPIPTSRKLLREEELRTTSLPSIPNPFPELCSPSSQTPILGGPSSARGLLPRDASCLHVSCPGKEKAGIWGCSGTGVDIVPLLWRWSGVPEGIAGAGKERTTLCPFSSHLQFLGCR